MKVTFSINYHTQWGESLFISGNLPELGNGNDLNAAEMHLCGQDIWELTIEADRLPATIEYGYIVKAQGKEWRYEYNRRSSHKFTAGKGIESYKLIDSWQDMPADLPYYTSAFTGGILMRRFRDQPLKLVAGTLQIRVSAPMVSPDEILAVSGSCEALGRWNPKQALRLNDSEYPVWTVNLPKEALKTPFEYKFVVLDKKTLELKCWENANNRIYACPAPDSREVIVVSGLMFSNPRNNWKGAGTAIPVFSLRSEEDFGVGDFYDIRKMVDWCELTGQKILQVLPINDTTKTKTWIDSYPYSANSSFALHPMYLRLEMAGRLKDSKRMARYAEIARKLNESQAVDYEAVNNVKEEYMRELYAERSKSLIRKSDYKKFVEANKNWLKPYAAWRVLRDIYDTPDSSKWGRYAKYDEDIVENFCNEHSEEIGFFYFLQYHLDKQLKDVCDYAHQHGVILKGDIPIGVGRDSVDAWKNTILFNMDSQAGAPPDDFSVYGQNWGFPTYNWEEMSRDGFSWWKNRFRKMADYFDAYRIDHILGFFRIWQIPLDAVHGLLGYFNPALPYSPEELRNSYDFWINPDVQCRPRIMEWMLGDFFHDKTEYAKHTFLEYESDGCYRLKEFVDSQKKVSSYFSVLPETEENKNLSAALMGLLDDVLFIEDPYKKGYYHPRITAQFTYQYRMLSEYEKCTFDRLYNDFYYRRHNEFWKGKALWKLPPIIYSTPMLSCAEDLGMIPDCVPEVMSELQILSLEIQRMPKDTGAEFGDTWHYPYHSVCTTSTHDMKGIRGWWEENRTAAQHYYNNVLHESGAAPFYAEPWICDKILELHLESPSMFCIIPLQDWLSADGILRRNNPAEEQINEPSNPKHYWRYRMHLSLEELLSQKAFNSALRGKIDKSGR